MVHLVSGEFDAFYKDTLSNFGGIFLSHVHNWHIAPVDNIIEHIAHYIDISTDVLYFVFVV